MAKEEGFKGPPATHKILRIGPERKLPVRFHAQISWWPCRSGAILRIGTQADLRVER